MTDKISLAVVGGTGRTGVPLVERALDRGHLVRALARSKTKARELLPDRTDIVVGDATDTAALSDLVVGVDVVLDVSGPVRGGPADYRARSTAALLAALGGREGVRLLHLTGAGVRNPDDRPGIGDRLVRGLMQLVARGLLDDSAAAAAMVATADVQHLVVRVPRLTEGPGRRSYRVAGAVGPDSGMQIARNDLADALLDLAEAATWPTGSPVVSA